MVKVGIIGSGFGVYGLLPAFSSTPKCKVVAICGGRNDNLISSPQKMDPKKIYSDWREMLNKEELEAVAIAVPPSSQYQIAKAAIKKGLHIFAEKPLAATLKQAQELLHLAEERKIKHIVDFLFPEIEEWIKVKQILDKKSFGQLKNIYLDWNFLSYRIKNNIKSWRSNVSLGGGALSFYFSHSLYYLEYFVGEISRLESLLSYSKDYGEVGVDLLLKFKNGVTGYAHLNSNVPSFNKHQLMFVFEKATIILESVGNGWIDFIIKIYSENGEQIISSKKTYEKNEDQRVKIIKKMTAKFINSIILNNKISPSFKEGVRVQELIEKIREKNA